MKPLRKSIQFLSDTLKRRDLPREKTPRSSSPEEAAPGEKNGEVFGYRWKNSRLSHSYRAIKRMTYQQWQ